LEAIKREVAWPGPAAVDVSVGDVSAGWEAVVDKKDFKVWKRPLPDSHLYEFRGQPEL